MERPARLEGQGISAKDDAQRGRAGLHILEHLAHGATKDKLALNEIVEAQRVQRFYRVPPRGHGTGVADRQLGHRPAGSS